MTTTSRSSLPAWLVGLVAGAVFAVGLALSGMTDPGKVLGFLDVAGAWDPTLAFVMGGAVSVHFAWLRLGSRLGAQAADSSRLPQQRLIDVRLLSGAALFGVGWGMSGYCPGPALVASAFGRREAWLFSLAMLGGMVLFNAFPRRAEQGGSLREPA